MKAAVYHSNTDIRIVDMPLPRIKQGELLLKVMASGICGSDLMEWYRVKKAPVVLGHEVAGVVEKVGKGIKNFKKGDRIFSTHHVACDACNYCRTGRGNVCETLRTTSFFPGGFAEYIRIPKINVEKGAIQLPDELSFEEGTFIEPLGCVVRAQSNLVSVKDQAVLVLGSGVSGILHIQLARVNGAKKIIATDVSLFRMNTALHFGANAVLSAESNVPDGVLNENKGRLADIAIVCTSSVQAMKQALASVDYGGTVIFFAPTEPGVELPIHVDELWLRGVSLTTSYGAVKKDLEKAMHLIATGKVNVKDMITHRLGLFDILEGFRIFGNPEGVLKVVIKPHELK